MELGNRKDIKKFDSIKDKKFYNPFRFYSTLMTNKKILGGGLSGLTAAINLAKAGYKVEVYEKNKDVGMRFGGDLQGLENWSEKKDILEDLEEMNVKTNFDYVPFSAIELRNCKTGRVLKFEKPIVYTVKRGSFPGTFDQHMKKLALKEGVKINFKRSIAPKEADIVATGPEHKRVMAVAKGVTFKTNHKDIIVGLVNDELAFRAYSYLIIAKGYGCLCSSVGGDLKRIGECFEKTKRFFEKKYRLKIKNGKKVGGVATFSFNQKYKSGKTLYVGEAAGLQDFLWGFGMRYAITSGYLAAQSIINKWDYEKVIHKRFKNKLKAGIVNRFLWEKLNRNEYKGVIDHSEALKNHIYSLNNYNIIQRVISPLAVRHINKEYPHIVK